MHLCPKCHTCRPWSFALIAHHVTQLYFTTESDTHLSCWVEACLVMLDSSLAIGPYIPNELLTDRAHSILCPLMALTMLLGETANTQTTHETKLYAFLHLHLLKREEGRGRSEYKSTTELHIDAALLLSLLSVRSLNRKQVAVLQQLAGGLWKVMECLWWHYWDVLISNKVLWSCPSIAATGTEENCKTPGWKINGLQSQYRQAFWKERLILKLKKSLSDTRTWLNVIDFWCLTYSRSLFLTKCCYLCFHELFQVKKSPFFCYCENRKYPPSPLHRSYAGNISK